ncbi:Retrovirus-related Pol polyprotein from type-1 retrotransposable element R2 [Frankliniella fusca]|uniref:Retrovirus-related Pol polyprotein from type-1 retrotransposable element R2 n=2 Tax=Frankliniella fusca TaxID=407009 RepID=A0AAE1L8E7_9NEOP|nr:Retrovirus-related Pol polyprotein from type-1 retrotransposable element R2 [Frankliniella fusca]
MTKYSIFNLPRRASPEIVFIPTQQGGANLPPLSELADVGSLVRAFKMLSCPDPAVQTIAEASIRHSAAPVLQQREPTYDQLCAYLSGDATPNYSRASTIWSAARSAARRLVNKLPGLRWSWTDSKRWSLTVPNQLKNTIIDAGSRKELHHHLRRSIQQYHLEKLLTKPDQGKVFDVSSRNAESNHFLQYGRHTRFCDWRFVHRARLGVLPLRACIRVANIDRKCRVCGYPEETTAHVLCHCMRHSRASNNRHRSVIKHLVMAMQSTRNLRVEKTVPGVNSRDKPDLVIINTSSKQAVIIDVACPFENRYEALERKRIEKVQKYLPLAEALQQQGFETVVDAVVVGSLGSWDPSNESSMALLGIPEKRRKTIKKLIISDVIRWSRDIYVEHVSRARQYKEDVVLPKL